MKITEKIIGGGLSVFFTAFKGFIRLKFDQERKRISLDELVEECETRVQDLEIADRLKTKKDASSEKQTDGWETDEDAINRAKEMPQRGWVLYGIIQEGTVCNFQSQEKTGKSTFVKQIAYDYASGSNSMSLPGADNDNTRQNDVFFYDTETDNEDIQERYGNLGDKRVNRLPNAYFESVDALTNHIRSSISTVKSNTLVILDNITTICPNITKGGVDKVRKEINSLQTEFCARGYRLTVILVHHTKASKKGDNTDDRAGSVEWGRIGKLNLTLLTSDLGRQYRELKVINSRGRNGLEENGIVFRIEDSPWLHFEFECYADSEVLEKKRRGSSNLSDNNKPIIDWKLSEEEADYVCDHFQPGKVGYGALAKDVLSKRGIVKPDEGVVNHMKNSVVRILNAKGLIPDKK